MNLPSTRRSNEHQLAHHPKILLLPGWQGSGPGHWQSLWAQRPDHQIVEQSDWSWPRRGDWMARLEEVVLESAAPLLLVAHSLGCHLVSAWAAHSRNHDRVHAALLVAPPDLDRPDLPPNLYSWRPVVLQRLPFASHVVASSNDPFASPDRSRSFADAWGGRLSVIDACGHVNGESGLGQWEQGLAFVDALTRPDGGMSSGP